MIKKFGGDEENRTPDPLLARQVLSQLSYAPAIFRLPHDGRPKTISYNPFQFQEIGGPKRTRTSDLTLIRRAL